MKAGGPLKPAFGLSEDVSGATATPRNPQPRCDILPCAQPPFRSIIVPEEDLDAVITASTLADNNQPQVSSFLDFAYKIFVMWILRGIPPLAPR